MADEDVINHVCELWGTRLWIFKLKNPRYKPVHRTELVGGSAVAMMQILQPHLSSRRQTQIDEAVATYQPLRSIKHKRFYVAPDGAEEFERYWLAGLLEGEAYFGLHPTSKHNVTPIVELNTVDHDVILRVQGILRDRYAISVNLHTRPPRQEGYQPQYHLACYGDAARAVMADIEPLMGTRRRQRIAELLGPAVQPRLLREAGPCYDVRRAA
ncbi:hypothetical protein K2Z83_09625 [Oscillochloris sp. ZM17-4]|uniref:hypothetical protein n=1 Tax=Oscillochloris sp. ZM17-4 TaxID=2866714 RepID=UPI001C730E85|nr:hypothetical protein [Oscillochloris sp. ZM17-4]MBX0327933.1 hypothetical protein [Oscillochloris sp. ZM17-4]